MDNYYYDEPDECPGVKDFRIDPDSKLKDVITEEEIRRYPILQKYIDAEEEEEMRKASSKDDDQKSENNEILTTKSLSSSYMYKDIKDEATLCYFDTSNSSNTDYISDHDDEDEDDFEIEYEDEDEEEEEDEGEDEDEDVDVDENVEKPVMKENIDLEKKDQTGWLSIKNYKDIKKQIVQKGLPLLETPKNGDICTINFMGTLENGKIVDSGFNCKVFIGYQTISEVLYIYL